jgi:hypothetical protein
MLVIVKWYEHNRQYEIGIKPFLKSMAIDVEDKQIEQAVKKLLEQQEMKPHGDTKPL